MIIARIASQRITSPTKAPAGERRPKKITDQSVFKMSWPINIQSKSRLDNPGIPAGNGRHSKHGAYNTGKLGNCDRNDEFP